MPTSRIVRGACAALLAVAALTCLTGCPCGTSADCPFAELLPWSCEETGCTLVFFANPNPQRGGREPQSHTPRLVYLYGAIPVDATLIGNALDRDLSAGPTVWHAERLVEAAR